MSYPWTLEKHWKGFTYLCKNNSVFSFKLYLLAVLRLAIHDMLQDWNVGKKDIQVYPVFFNGVNLELQSQASYPSGRFGCVM